MARVASKTMYNLKVDQHEYDIIVNSIMAAMNEMDRLHVTVPPTIRALYQELQESKI